MDDLLDDMPEDGPRGNAPEFTVSEISGAVKRTIESGFSHVRVRGEIGRLSLPRSGHVYLDLKDDRSVLASVIWKGTAARLRHPPEEGMEVVATGRLTTFPASRNTSSSSRTFSPRVPARSWRCWRSGGRRWRPRGCSTRGASGPCPTCRR
jgi:hypothetical protein